MVEANYTDALIGKTGFVGGNLARQHAFSASFSRSDIHSSVGHSYSTVVCAAAPGSMFAANRDPDGDAASVDAVISALSRIRAKRLVLISTIAVLKRFDGQQDEDTNSFETEKPYGVNRRRLEVFCTERFESALIIRLPALFGPGLRKNFIFDILNPIPAMLSIERLARALDALPSELRQSMASLYLQDEARRLMVLDRERVEALPERLRLEAALVRAGHSAREFTHPDSSFQFYDINALWNDIKLAMAARLHILHIAPEPLRAGDVHLALTGLDMPNNTAPVHHEDLRTRHAKLWGRDGFYSTGGGFVLERLRQFHAVMSLSGRAA
jgi:hypothetical protein